MNVPLVGISRIPRISPTLFSVLTGPGSLILTYPGHVFVSIETCHELFVSISFLAVFCPEDEIPPFKENTQTGTINNEELKKADPEYWNKFQRRLTYTCPVGYVIERPNGDYSEQQDPVPLELETFEVECAANAVWTPRPKDGGNYMPSCIRKLGFLPRQF